MTGFPNFGLINQMSRHLANNAAPKILDYQTNGNDGYVYKPSSTDLITPYSSVGNGSLAQQQRFNAIADQLMYASRNANIANLNGNVNGNPYSNLNGNPYGSGFEYTNAYVNGYNNGYANGNVAGYATSDVIQGGNYPGTVDLSSYLIPTTTKGVDQRIMKQESIIDKLVKPISMLKTKSSETGSSRLNTTVQEGKINDMDKESFDVDSIKVGLMGSGNNESQQKINIIGIVIICFIVFMLIQLYLSQKKIEFMMSVYDKRQGSERSSERSNGNGAEQFSVTGGYNQTGYGYNAGINSNRASNEIF